MEDGIEGEEEIDKVRREKDRSGGGRDRGRVRGRSRGRDKER
jgi:hypothetical protein